MNLSAWLRTGHKRDFTVEYKLEMEDGMKNLAGLKMAICQMKVIPGRPDLNADYMIGEIEAAQKRNLDVIVFPEMCVTGYLIADQYEDVFFANDIRIQNERIREASASGITVIFGSLVIDPAKKGEDGRVRRMNSVLAAQNGKWIHEQQIGEQTKSLLPNYRIFDDDRYFYSTRKIRDEENEQFRQTGGKEGDDHLSINNYLQPFPMETSIGEIKVGATACEDMWHDDYMYNPVQFLCENGANIIVNVSASPWSWQKNRKRHSVVKNTLSRCPVPFVYVNNTGMQNNGDNLVAFDGSSTVYNPQGEIAFEIGPYVSGTHDYIFTPEMVAIRHEMPGDTAQLFDALMCMGKEYVNNLPPEMRRIFVGLSGGIDSAVNAALVTLLVGPENTYFINMPMSGVSGERHIEIARQVADNLGSHYESVDITEIVNAVVRATGVEEGTLAWENIQARSRMEVLAARAQKVGGVFTANFNKVEAAFGYGTLYGDIAGFMALIGDLVKREVYQLAYHINREVFGRDVIPRECFDVPPTAELARGQRDPFDYGNLNRRGYHDEMARALVEFRLNPEWFLEQYIKGTLEESLLLEPGTLKRLFRTTRDFIKDLEKQWGRFHGAIFKRIQVPPIPIVSKRAFGMDLRESILPAYLTGKYQHMKKFILSRNAGIERVAIFGGSLNPPCKHHIEIAKKLAQQFSKVIVVPCGMRSDKETTKLVSVSCRMEMVKMCFQNISKVELDCSDLENDVYTPTYLLDKHYRNLYPQVEIWHVIGEDIITGGAKGDSEIHRVWHRGREIWQNLNFLVIARPGYGACADDMPPSSQFMEIGGIYGSGSLVRERLEKGQPIEDLVTPEIDRYIRDNRLYQKA